jgi:DNA modification methylase
MHKKFLLQLNMLHEIGKLFNADWKYPSNVLTFPAVVNNSREKLPHPTQKASSPTEYLIKTYTNEGETVLDNCIGSGDYRSSLSFVKPSFYWYRIVT